MSEGKKWVPKLRFPEFRGADGWGQKKISDILSPAIREVAKPSSRYLAVGIRSHGKGTFHKPNQEPEKNSMDRLYLVHHDDLIVSITFAWEGAIAIASGADHGGFVSHRFPTYAFKPSISTPTFFRYVISNSAFTYKLVLISPGGAGRNRVMNKKGFLEISVVIPSLLEQKKIADCLSSLDELIAAQGRKVDAIKIYRKGLMQQFLPREGETQPRMRFHEFRDAPAWGETSIGAIGSFYYGKSAPKWSLEEDAPTKCVRYGELYNKFGTIITETYSRTNIDSKNLRFSKGGEILVPRVGEKPEDFGKCCCYLPLKNIAIGEMISVFETKQDPLFYTYYFRNLYKEFAGVVEGQNVKNLYYVNLEPIPIGCPPIAEQERLAKFFASLDDLITAQIRQLENLRSHKNGLIQKLFPSPEEVEA